MKIHSGAPSVIALTFLVTLLLVVSPDGVVGSYEFAPTIVSTPNFDAMADAEALRKALKGFGTDIPTVIKIMGGRTAAERLKIAEAYKSKFNRDLTKDMKSDTNRKLEKMLVVLLTPPANYDASRIHKAIRWLGTDFDLILEILFTRNYKQLQAMAQAYQTMYKKSVVKAINGDVHGKVEKFLDAILKNGPQNMNVDAGAALKDAQALASGTRFGKLLGGKSDLYTEIFTKNNHNQLKLIFEQFQRLTKRSIEEEIKKNSFRKFQTTLLTFVECVRNTPLYFAQRIHKALKGFGTDDSALIRILVTRCQVDLENIKTAYYYKFNKILKHAITADVSGKFQEMVLAILKGNKSPIAEREKRNVGD